MDAWFTSDRQRLRKELEEHLRRFEGLCNPSTAAVIKVAIAFLTDYQL
jgi:hypothetical protein